MILIHRYTTMMNIIKKIFMAIGIFVVVIIVIIAILIGALIYYKPYNIDVIKAVPAILNQNTQTTSTYDHPLLNTQQEILLQSAGIDPATVPTEVTAAQQKCAIDLFGNTRVNEILAGDTPTITEIIRGKECLD